MAIPLVLMIVAAAAPPPAPAALAAPAASPQAAVAHGSYGRPFLSPMGEPFFGRRPGEDGLTAWFEQADRNHDGVLTADELAADAQRFFALLDVNHDGEIDPDEINRYETVIAPQVRNGPLLSRSDFQQDASQPRSGGHERGGRSGGRRGGGGGGHHWSGGGDNRPDYNDDDESRGGRYGLLEIPEPVASADTDFNRGVSAEEFRQAALSRFALLDASHQGRLTLQQLQRIRGAVATDSRRSHQKPSDTDQPVVPPDDDGQGPM